MRLAAAALVALLGSAAAHAADAYPTRPVHLVVPFAAGGGTDLVARAVADAIAQDWKATIVVDNKPGAGTTLGAVAVAQAPADGYSVLANTASFLISPHMMAKQPYDAARDFVPVALLASSPHVLVVGPNVPVKTLSEFTAWAKAQPQPPTFASFGTGSSSHLGYEILRSRLGLAMVHVPYRGAAPALLDLLGGRVDTMLADLSAVAEHVKSGAVRAIAVTSDRRAASLPDVPTIKEAGLDGFRSESWFGLVAKAGTDADVVRRWNAAANAALANPSVRSKLEQIGIEPLGSTPEAFGAFMRDEAEKYVAAVKQSGAKLD